MIKLTCRIRPVKRLNILFTYILFNRDKKLYYKDYQTDTPLKITKDQLQVAIHINTATILIEQNGNLYWCPQFEEMYKDYKTTWARHNMERLASITKYRSNITLNFTANQIKYETQDVKQVIII